MNDTVTCPSCGTHIELTQALLSQALAKEQEKFESQLSHVQEEKELLLKKMTEEKATREKELEEEKVKIKAAFTEKANERLQQLEIEMRAKITDENNLRQKDLENRLVERDAQLKKNESMMLDLMKQLRDQETKSQEIRIESERRIGEEIKVAFAKAQKSASEQYEMQIKERDKMNEDLRKKIEELQMKATESSVQIRGEIQELELEQLLRELFPSDTIEPIGKGKFGADIAQKVRDQYGRLCGVLLWESKHTKTWQNDWLPKLREDLRTYKAHIAILATLTLPESISSFGMKDGIWVTNYDSLPGLAIALRQQLISVAYERNASSGKGEKMEMLYNYLIGHEFKQKIEAIVEVFTVMREDLEKEKIAFEKIWKKREMQLARLAVNTSRMYGEMQGLVGSALPDVRGLELDSGAVVKGDPVSLFDEIA